LPWPVWQATATEHQFGYGKIEKVTVLAEAALLFS
jgi:hypothetical protein